MLCEKLVPGTVATFSTMGAAGSIGQVGVVPMGLCLAMVVESAHLPGFIGDVLILGMARPAYSGKINAKFFTFPAKSVYQLIDVEAIATSSPSPKHANISTIGSATVT